MGRAGKYQVFLSLSLDGGAGLQGSAALTPVKEMFGRTFGRTLCVLQSRSVLSGEEKDILLVK
jgi:hypothetical protein